MPNRPVLKGLLWLAVALTTGKHIQMVQPPVRMERLIAVTMGHGLIFTSPAHLLIVPLTSTRLMKKLQGIQLRNAQELMRMTKLYKGLAIILTGGHRIKLILGNSFFPCGVVLHNTYAILVIQR